MPLQASEDYPFSSHNRSDYFGGAFPDPFTDIASMAAPKTVHRMLRYCEFIVGKLGLYRQAIERVLSYFITDIEVRGDISDDEKDKYKEFATNELKIILTLHDAGMNELVYGNSFVSAFLKFSRYLSCPKCYSEFPLRVVIENSIFNFSWNNCTFGAKCPSCKYNGDWGDPVDRKWGSDGFRIKHYSPYEIEIAYDEATGDRRYFWKIPPDYANKIKNGTGDFFHVERANWEVIKAIRSNRYFEFDEDVFYHAYEEPFAGIKHRGWGIPKTLSNFSQAYFIQTLQRANEAIAFDYTVPLRVVTPAPQGGGDPQLRDPLLNRDMGSFVSQMRKILRRHRQDPAQWNVLAQPVQYNTLGGDAKALMPKDLLELAYDSLLTSIGIPVELFKGSLTIQAAPVALRLFESQWQHLISSLNGLLEFISNRLSELLGWEKCSLFLSRVTHTDNIEAIQARLQLMTGGVISKDTGLRPLGIDAKEESRKIHQEEKFDAKEDAETQEELEGMSIGSQLSKDPSMGGAQQDPSGGQQGAGGAMAPMPTDANGNPVTNAVDQVIADATISPNTPITPQDAWGRADTTAKSILSMPDSQRQSALIKLKKSNPMLHPLVKSIIENYRNSAKTTGQQQVMAQQFGQP